MQSLLPSSDSLTCHLVVEPVCQVRLKRFTWKEKSKEYLKSDLNLLSIGKLNNLYSLLPSFKLLCLNCQINFCYNLLGLCMIKLKTAKHGRVQILSEVFTPLGNQLFFSGGGSLQCLVLTS